MEGWKSVLNLLAILILSWAISQTVRDLGFGTLVKSAFFGAIPAWAIPTVIFLAGAAYIIGSSWATWAILMPLAAGLAQAGQLNPAMVFGAVWAGGSVGDSTSPLADLPILMSGMTKKSANKFAGGALPFALLGAALAASAYLVAGITNK